MSTAGPHEVTGVEYVPVCDQCWEPVEEHEEMVDGRWTHVGFRHLDPALNPGSALRQDGCNTEPEPNVTTPHIP